MNYFINIIGNIASGKSTLLEQLRPQLPDFEFYQIDELRVQYPKLADPYLFSMVGKKVLHEGRNVVFEHCGTNDAFAFWARMLAIAPNVQPVFLFAVCPPNLCLERYYQRQSKLIPNIVATITEINDKLQQLSYPLDPCLIVDTTSPNDIPAITKALFA